MQSIATMPRSYLRPALSGTNGHHRVTNIELFFDLVFVFAVTQLSHLLIANFTLVGGAQALLLMLAVWWVWIFTSWVTNWLDPEKLAATAALASRTAPRRRASSIDTRRMKPGSASHRDWIPGSGAENYVASAIIEATKPRSTAA